VGQQSGGELQHLLVKASNRDQMKFQGKSASGVIHENPAEYPPGTLMVKGVASTGDVVEWIAADPPARIMSNPGSFLAYPSPQVAISGSNCGTAEIVNGTFIIYLRKPNAYYANGGTILLPPHITIRIWNRGEWVGDTIATLGTILPNKGLTYAPQRTSPMFYTPRDTSTPKSQEQILRDSIWRGEISVRQYAERF